MVDNHHTSNVIFAGLNVDGVTPLPPEVWDRVREVREALLRTIEELSPPDWSFVFTNVLTDDKPGDRAVWSDSVRARGGLRDRDGAAGLHLRRSVDQRPRVHLQPEVRHRGRQSPRPDPRGLAGACCRGLPARKHEHHER